MPEPRPDWPPAGATHADWIERAVIAQLGILIVGLSWSFGGQIQWARDALLGWGALGVLLFLTAAVARFRAGRSGWVVLRDLWPLLAFNLLVGASCLNPSFKVILREGQAFFQVTPPPHAWLPSSARPDLSLRELLQFNGIVLSCYNAYLVLRSRRQLRLLLAVIAANALTLAVFGTFQKLVGAPGLWFGLVESPQKFFFSTFVYHNHWGAFTVLNTAACLALFFHVLRFGGYRDVWHSPVPLGGVAILFIAASVPLSASRSSSALMCLLLLAAFVHFLARLIRRRRARRASLLPPVLAACLAVALAGGAIGYLARDVIAQRTQLTQAQLRAIRAEDNLNSRLVVYRDTWRAAQEKPWFGWGLETYGDVFRIYNSQRTPERWTPYYREAHNDWLQSLAETGFVGTGLLVLLGAIPLLRAPWRRLESATFYYLTGGCALILLYAWVEFPLANPSVMVGLWSTLYLGARYARLDATAPRSEKAS